MVERTQLEKIADSIKMKERLQSEKLTVIRDSRRKEWNKEVEKSPFNDFYGVDIQCAVAIMKAMQRGLDAKDAVRISEHIYKVPAQRTGDLLYKYSENGEEAYKDIIEIERKNYNKRLINKMK